MTASLVALLRKHKVKQAEYKLFYGQAYVNLNLVCCYPDGRNYVPSNFSPLFANFLKKHKLKAVRFHDLRHSNATLMLKYGVPAKIASARLGHSSIAITMDLYSHVLDDMQDEVVEALDDRLMSRVNKESIVI